MLVFSTSFVKHCPSNLLLVSSRIRIHTKISWIRNTAFRFLCFLIYIWSMDRTYGKDYVWEEEVVPRPSKASRGGRRPSSAGETPQEARPQASSSFVKARAGGQRKRKASGQLEETDTKVRVGWKRHCFLTV
jgi:hypothetical protein